MKCDKADRLFAICIQLNCHGNITAKEYFSILDEDSLIRNLKECIAVTAIQNALIYPYDVLAVRTLKSEKLMNFFEGYNKIDEIAIFHLHWSHGRFLL